MSSGARCPVGDEPLEALLDFATTYNAYVRLASEGFQLQRLLQDSIDTIWRNGAPSEWMGVDLLRAALFYLSRRSHFEGDVSDDDELVVRAIVRAISERVGDARLLVDDEEPRLQGRKSAEVVAQEAQPGSKEQAESVRVLQVARASHGVHHTTRGLPSNPWLDLPRQPPYVLACDEPVLRQFAWQENPVFSLHTELPPEPFMGDLHAPIVLLNLNPGFDGSEPSLYRKEASIIEALLANTSATPRDWPFTFLDPIAAATPGSRWWRSKLGPLIKSAGIRRVATRVLCVEYFPYHSARYRDIRGGVPSQQFSRELVRAAIDREAEIVILRSHRRWVEAVPELERKSVRNRVFALKNPQNVVVSPQNCPAAAFDRLAARLRSDDTDPMPTLGRGEA